MEPLISGLSIAVSQPPSSNASSISSSTSGDGKENAASNSHLSTQEKAASASLISNLRMNIKLNAERREREKWETPVGVLLAEMKILAGPADPLIVYAEKRVFLKNVTVGRSFPHWGALKFFQALKQSGVALPGNEFRLRAMKSWDGLTPLNRAFLALLLKVPQEMFRRRDVMLMTFIQGDGAGNKKVARAVLLAVAHFKEIIGSTLQDRAKVLEKLCTAQDFYALLPRKWGTNMIVRCMIALVEWGPEAEAVVPGAKYSDPKNSAMSTVEDAYTFTMQRVLDPKLCPAKLEHLIMGQLGNQWWASGPAAIQAFPGRKRSDRSETAEELQELTFADQKYAISVVQGTDWSYTALPKSLREDLPSKHHGPKGQQKLEILSKNLGKLHADLFKLRTHFLASLKSGTIKDETSYVHHFSTCKSWNNYVGLLHHLLVTCGPVFSRVLSLPDSGERTPGPKKSSINSRPGTGSSGASSSRTKRKPDDGQLVTDSPEEMVESQDIKRRKLDLLAKQLELAETKMKMERGILQNFNKLLPGYNDAQWLQGLLSKKQKELASCYKEISAAEERNEEVFLLQSLDRSKLRLQNEILKLEAKLDSLVAK